MNRLKLIRKLVFFFFFTWAMAVKTIEIGCASELVESPEYGSAKLVTSNRPGEQIAGLQWSAYTLPIFVLKDGDQRQAVVQLHGKIDRTDINLVSKDRSIPIESNPDGTGSFTQNVVLTGKITLLTYFTVDPYGHTQQENVAMIFPDWKNFRLPLTKNLGPMRRILTSAGLGLTHESYNEPGGISLSENTTTGKFSIVYLLDPGKWELGGNLFTNLLTLSHSPDDREAARWYGINGRIGYRLPVSIPSTSLWLMTGWYMWGMLVPSDPAGAQNDYGIAFLTGPQIFVTARITPPHQHAGWIYLKLASISDPSSPFSLVNRELAGGGGIALSDAGVPHPLSLTVDFADAKYGKKYADLAQGPVSFHLFSLSLGVSVGL